MQTTDHKGQMRRISVPLETQIWERDLLYKRMELCRVLYNRQLNEAEHSYRALMADPQYRDSRRVIDAAYAERGERREEAKRSADYREAIRVQSQLMHDYGLTAFSAHMRSVELAREYKGLLPSRVAHFTIGSSMWHAVHSVMLGLQTGFCYKSKGDLKTLSSDGRSGIRLLGPDGYSIRDGVDIDELPEMNADDWTREHGALLSVVYGKGKGRRGIRLPLLLKEDERMRKALASPLHVIQIRRKEIHGRDRYFMDIIVEWDRDGAEEALKCIYTDI